MDFELFRAEMKSDVFDYQMLASHLEGLRKPRDKVMSLILQGKIVRIKKGLYIFGERWRRAPLSLEVIAGLIYGPSCISFEYALTRYGAMAERSLVVTSLALGKTKAFHTPIGLFEYRAMARERFKIGIEYRDLGDQGGFLIASKEKAIADLVYRTAAIRNIEQLRYFLFEEMRIDEDMFRTLDFAKLKEIANTYNKKSVYMLGEL